MKKYIFLAFCLLFLVNSEKIKVSGVKGNLPKIPGFVGLGYHALRGNPFTTHVDEGFRAPLFEMTYEKGQTTDDGQFLIPDNTYSTQTLSCSMNAETKSYSGTQNYQKQLSNMVNFEGQYSVGFMEAKFSFSNSFATFSNSTVGKNQTASHSNAQCIVYKVQMPLYSTQFKLTEDFISGVKIAFLTNSWGDFINHFGTHYATGVSFGGRYFLQHTYSQESISLFKSMQLDIKLAAKVQFFQKNGIALTDQLKNYVNQTKIINTKVLTESTSTIGGLPPKSGDWIEWSTTVKNNLAPLSYDMHTISSLFGFISGIDVVSTTKSFLQFIDLYCTRYACPKIVPDRPQPLPLKAVFSKSFELVGPAKGARTFDTNDGLITPGMRVSKVMLGGAGNIDSMQIFLSNGLIQHTLPKVGEAILGKKYETQYGDQIKCIRFGVGYQSNTMKFVSIQFVTHSGKQSQQYKYNNNVAEYRVLCVQNSSQHFVGIYGHWGITFDSIGLNIMSQVLQSSNKSDQQGEKQEIQ